MTTPTKAELKFVDYLKQENSIKNIHRVLRGEITVISAFRWSQSPEREVYWSESYTGLGTINMTPESVEKLVYYLELAGEDTSEFDHLKPVKFEPSKSGARSLEMSITLSAKQGVTYQGFCLLEQVLDPNCGELLYPAFTIVPLRVLYDLANNHIVPITKCISIICPESEVSHYLKIQQECATAKVAEWVESEEQPGIFHPVFAS